MTSSDDLKRRREEEAKRIRSSLNRQRGVQHSSLKGGETAVAFVQESLCIGCDQCTIVCDDDAIEMYKMAMRSPYSMLKAIKKRKLSEMLALDADYVFSLVQQMLSP